MSSNSVRRKRKSKGKKGNNTIPTSVEADIELVREKEAVKRPRIQLDEDDLPRGGNRSKGKRKREIASLYEKKQSIGGVKTEKTRSKEATAAAKSVRVLKTTDFTKSDSAYSIGVVKRHTRFEAIVHLPFNARGTIHVSSISDSYASHLQALMDADASEVEGEEITAISRVLPLDTYVLVKSEKGTLFQEKGRRGAQLTTNPGTINEKLTQESFVSEAATKSAFWGSIASIEEKGYLVEFGVENVTGFLPFSNSQDRENSKYVVGQPLFVFVDSVERMARRTVVTLSTQPEHSYYNVEVAQEMLQVPSVGSLLPGSMLRFKVHRMLGSSGAQLNIGFEIGQWKGKKLDGGMSFLAFCHRAHVGAKALDHLEEASGTEGEVQYYQGRIIFADFGRRLIYISLLTDILNVTDTKRISSYIGERFEKAKVLHVEGSTVEVDLGTPEGHYDDDIVKGLLVSIGSEKKEKGKHLEGTLKGLPVGTIVEKCRAVDYRQLESLYIVTSEDKIVDGIVSVADLKPGMEVVATVTNVMEKGVFVMLGSGLTKIRAIITRLHASDVFLSEASLRKKFTLNKPVKCRVLNIVDGESPEKTKVFLTAKKTLLCSEHELITAYETAQNVVTHGVITEIRESGMFITFYGGVCGFVPTGNVASSYNEGRKEIMERYKMGDVVKCCVLQVFASTRKMSLSMKPSDIEACEGGGGPQSSVVVGDVVICTVNNVYVGRGYIDVTLKGMRVTGRIPFFLASRNALTLNSISLEFKKGDEVEGIVMGKRYGADGKYEGDTKLFVIVSLISQRGISTEEKESFKGSETVRNLKDTPQAGSIMSCRIVKETKDEEGEGQASLWIPIQLSSFPKKIFGRAHICDVSDEFQENVMDTLSMNSYVNCKILKVNKIGNKSQIDVSLRESDVEEVHMKDSCSLDWKNVRRGAIYPGYVTGASRKGVFVALSRNVYGRVKLSQTFDDERRQPANKPFEQFRVGKAVITKVIEKDEDSNNIELSLRESFVRKEGFLEFKDFKVGMDYEGVVEAISKNGALIQLVDSSTLGFFNWKDSDLTKEAHYNELQIGARMQFRILLIEQSVRIKLAMVSTPQDVTATTGGLPSFKDAILPEQKSAEESSNVDRDENNHTLHVFEKETNNLIRFDDQFQWDPDFNEDFGETEDGEGTMKESRGSVELSSERRRAAIQEERKVAEKEERNVKQFKPENVEDFERLLLTHPNSSYLWIRYMAFHISLADIDKARFIAERALDSISFRMEDEKFSVWVAFINFEYKYGTEKRLYEVFERATRANSSLKIHKVLAKLYEDAGKLEACDDVYLRMTKKFRDFISVWKEWLLFRIRSKGSESGNEILEKAITVLAKKQHPELLTFYAAKEFQLGSKERGRTVFESLISTYPKRLDIWKMYSEMESNFGSVENARTILNRAALLNLSQFKMRSFFEYFLRFESQNGDEQTVEAVKELARNYVRRKMED